MRKHHILSLILAMVCMLSMVSYAAAAEQASLQISSYSIGFYNDPGCVGVEFDVTGTDRMNKLGCSHFEVYEKEDINDDDGWILIADFDEDDPGMSDRNSGFHANAIDTPTEIGKCYLIRVTIFAEDDDGRDSRSAQEIITTTR